MFVKPHPTPSTQPLEKHESVNDVHAELSIFCGTYLNKLNGFRAEAKRLEEEKEPPKVIVYNYIQMYMIINLYIYCIYIYI